MSTNDLVMPAPRKDVLVTNRLLGTLGMLASPMMLAEMLTFGFKQHGSNQVIGVLGVIYTGGWICSAVGMRRSRVTGDGALSKGVFVLQLFGLLLAFLWSLQEIISSGIDTSGVFYRVTDAAWPLSHLLMLVIGILNLRAGVWEGWRRFAPLLVGLALPAAIAAAVVGGEAGMGITFAAMTTAGFFALGYSVRTESGTHGRA
jgi:hypothetical protein